MDQHREMNPEMRKRLSVLTGCMSLMCAMVLFSGCGGGGGGTPPAPPVQTMTIQVQVPSNTPAGDTVWMRTGMLFGEHVCDA